MLFDTFDFLLVFLPLSYGGYLLCRQSRSVYVCLSFIIFSSIIFHTYYKSSYTYLLIFSLSFNYMVSYFINISSKHKKSFLIIGLAFNLLLLSYFKYYNFFVSNINFLYNGFSTKDIILPLGISFYTFQQIGFLIDCYRGESKTYSVFEYFSYILFFPHLIAGPIIPHNELISQLNSKKILASSFSNTLTGVMYIFIGLFKKVFISDNCSSYVDPIFEAVHNGFTVSAIELWYGVFLFSFVIYFDFSGYSDIAIGIARFFNIKFPVNFDSPYKALNFIDFWRRWHITLSNFLKKYVYFSLGNNKKNSFRQYISILFTMSLSGLWHGANWNFIIWGLFHGFLIVINHFWKKYKTKINIPDFGNITVWCARIMTFICISLSWVFFRANSFEESLIIFKGMFTNNLNFSVLTELNYKLFNVPYYYIFEPAIIIFLLLWLVWFFPNSQEYIKKNFIFEIKNVNNLKFNKNCYIWENIYIQIVCLSFLGMLAIMNINYIKPFTYFSF